MLQKLNELGYNSSAIFTWPLANWLPLLQATRQLLAGKMLPQPACVCAKSLQLCPTLCHPMDCTPQQDAENSFQEFVKFRSTDIHATGINKHFLLEKMLIVMVPILIIKDVFEPSSWRRKWKPTPVLLSGESHGQRSLAGYSPWGHKESDTTEQLTLSQNSFTPNWICRAYISRLW